MRHRLAVSLLAVLVLAATGCDLVSDPGGPRPEDFAVEEDSAEVRASGDEDAIANSIGDVQVRQDVASPLSTARSGMTLSISAPR
jgi:hypothetical protein